jgi:lipoate-protein ligase A
MPVRMGKKKFKTFAAAKKAVAKKGIKNPAAYVAQVERLQGRDPRTGKKVKGLAAKTRRKAKKKKK